MPSRSNLFAVVAATAVTVACSSFAIGRAVVTDGAAPGVPVRNATTSAPLPDAPPAAARAAVQIVDFAFEPSPLTVKAGSAVTWTNADAFAHSIRSTDAAFDEETMGEGASATVTFTAPGTYTYICGIHNSMTGTVVVEP